MKFTLMSMLGLYWQCRVDSTLYQWRSVCTRVLCMFLNMHMKAHVCNKANACTALSTGWMPSFYHASVQESLVYLHQF